MTRRKKKGQFPLDCCEERDPALAEVEVAEWLVKKG